MAIHQIPPEVLFEFSLPWKKKKNKENPAYKISYNPIDFDKYLQFTFKACKDLKKCIKGFGNQVNMKNDMDVFYSTSKISIYGAIGIDVWTPVNLKKADEVYKETGNSMDFHQTLHDIHYEIFNKCFMGVAKKYKMQKIGTTTTIALLNKKKEMIIEFTLESDHKARDGALSIMWYGKHDGDDDNYSKSSKIEKVLSRI